MSYDAVGQGLSLPVNYTLRQVKEAIELDQVIMQLNGTWLPWQSPKQTRITCVMRLLSRGFDFARDVDIPLLVVMRGLIRV